jgi:hypothetical protein
MILAKLIGLCPRILVLAGLFAGCHMPSGGDKHSRFGGCLTRSCDELGARLPGHPPMLLKGAELELVRVDLRCEIEVSWPLSKGGAERFQAMLLPDEGDALPLRDGLAQLGYCAALACGPPAYPPQAGVIPEPGPLPWPALGPDEVFVPLGGDATLDKITYVSATLALLSDDGSPAPPQVSLSLRSLAAQPEPDHYPLVHEGDEFRWGDRGAQIVRIVRTCTWRDSCGWVVVKLSERGTPT